MSVDANGVLTTVQLECPNSNSEQSWSSACRIYLLFGTHNLIRNRIYIHPLSRASSSRQDSGPETAVSRWSFLHSKNPSVSKHKCTPSSLSHGLHWHSPPKCSWLWLVLLARCPFRPLLTGGIFGRFGRFRRATSSKRDILIFSTLSRITYGRIF
jgi:4-amino-4-deoxy-L-arabinose transferase-like glycosyltransferase